MSNNNDIKRQFDFQKDDFSLLKKKTVFDQITESTEALSEFIAKLLLRNDKGAIPKINSFLKQPIENVEDKIKEIYNDY